MGGYSKRASVLECGEGLDRRSCDVDANTASLSLFRLCSSALAHVASLLGSS